MAKSKKQSSKAVNGNVVSADFNKMKEVEEVKSRDVKWSLLKPKDDGYDCTWHEDNVSERLWNQLDYVFELLQEYEPDGCILSCYAKDDFPRDIEMSERYELLKDYPRDVVNAWLMQDIVEGRFCREHGEERLTKLFKKYDSIQKKANKQWLRVLIKEAYEAGVFDEGGDDANIIS